MGRKTLIVIAITLVLIVLAIWSPWRNWNLNWINLLGIDSKEEFAGLHVVSLAGNISVYIDEEYQGTAEAEVGFFEITPISPGEHLITLEREGNQGQYTDIVRKVNFEAGVDVIIGYEIGPTEEFSEGHILSTRKSFVSEDGPFLEIFSAPDGLEASLDGQFIGHTPLKQIKFDINSKHKLLFESEGYDPLEIEILPDTQEERDKLADLVITLEINLFARPVEIVTN